MYKQIMFSQFGVMFILHFLGIVFTWVAPFLVSWPLPIAVYSIITIQFWIFNRCLVNRMHKLEEDDNQTFYNHLFQLVGFDFNPKTVKFIVRKAIYPVLVVFTLWLQLVYGWKPLWF